MVGDVAQRGSAAVLAAQMLDPYVGGRWREELLSVNYRTPAEDHGGRRRRARLDRPGRTSPESVREEGVTPRAVQAADGPDGVAGVVEAEGAGMGDAGGGDRADGADRGRRRAGAAGCRAGGAAAEVLDSPVALLTVGQAKGLEFDRVVVVDPAGIIAGSPVGGHDLYVAITRATHRLAVVYRGDLPASMRHLA